MPFRDSNSPPTPEERVQQAKGSFTKKSLVKKKGRLNDQRVVDYLDPDEQIEYLLWHQYKGLRIFHTDGEEETPHHDSTEGARFLLITDQRLCYLAGLEDRDEQRDFSYDQLTNVEATNNTFTDWITFTTTDGTKYRFAETGTHFGDVEPAAVYIQEEIEKRDDELIHSNASSSQTGNSSDLRQQMRDAFRSGEYPATSLMDVAPALPQGPSTTFESGEFSVKARDLCSFIIFTSNMSFPYGTVDEFVDEILQELVTHGHITPSKAQDSTGRATGRSPSSSGGGTSDTRVYSPGDNQTGSTHSDTDQQTAVEAGGQSDLSLVNYCPYCGTDTAQYDGSRFCPSCGKEIG